MEIIIAIVVIYVLYIIFFSKSNGGEISTSDKKDNIKKSNSIQCSFHEYEQKYGHDKWTISSDRYGGYKYKTCTKCGHSVYESIVATSETCPSRRDHTYLLNTFGPNGYTYP